MLFPEIARDEVFILGSQRLWLRWPRLGDAAAFAKFAGDNSVSDMTASWPYPLPDGEVEKRIAQYRIHNLNGAAMVFVMTPWNEPGRAIGMIGALFKGGEDVFSVGYMLHRDFWGRGLMSEALPVVVDTAFRLTRATAAVAGVRVVNPASRRVLEKLGFVETGRITMPVPARGTEEAVDQFRLDRAAWQKGINRRWAALAERSATSASGSLEECL